MLTNLLLGGLGGGLGAGGGWVRGLAPLRGGFLIDNSDCRHREVIDARARDGWRYVGYVPMEYMGSGIPQWLDLIFEREEADEPC